MGTSVDKERIVASRNQWGSEKIPEAREFYVDKTFLYYFLSHLSLTSRVNSIGGPDHTFYWCVSVDIKPPERDNICRAHVGAFSWSKFFWVLVDSIAS